MEFKNYLLTILIKNESFVVVLVLCCFYQTLSIGQLAEDSRMNVTDMSVQKLRKNKSSGKVGFRNS